MKSNQWLKILVIVVTLVVSWILLVYAADWPTTQESHYVCPICRAGKTVTSYLMIPMRTRINDNGFSRYYRKHADPKHRHIWLGCGVRRETRTGGISAHGTPDPLKLKYEVALAILKSLPDAKTRKAFFEHLYVPDKSLPESQRVSEAISKLNGAYWENEHRKDWLNQLRKVGLYPNIVSSKR